MSERARPTALRLAPLVEPSGPLSAAELLRYSRHVMLPGVGQQGQRRLAAARVLVLGAGGLGSPVISYLAAAGVGTIGIVDDDVVETSNLARQVIHRDSGTGRAKVDSAAESVADVNPHVRVVRHVVRLGPGNALDLMRGYDLVMDGTDNFETRYLVNDACEILGLPCVWGSVLRFDGQVSLFWARPRSAPGSAPADGVTYRDVFGDPPPPHLVPSCAEAGVFGALCAAVGSVMAMEAVKLVCGLGEPLLGRLLVLDALAMSWRSVTVRAGVHVPVTQLAAAEAPAGDAPASDAPASGEPSSAEEIGARELAALLAGPDAGDVLVVDVREAGEREIVDVPGSHHIPLARFVSGEAVAELTAPGRPARLVLYCRTGGRSARALALLRAAGVQDAVHLRGGVLAWVEAVEPHRSRY